MSKIVLSEAIHEDGIRLLREKHEVEIAADPSESTLSQAVVDAAALIVRSSAISARTIHAAPALRVIGRHGIGVDNIDLQAASARKIPVVNTPEANTVSVAEYTVAAMLFFCKRLKEADAAMRKGVFRGPGSLPGQVTKLGYTACELQGKRLGLVGFGRIAGHVARMCRDSFGMIVSGYDSWVSREQIQQAGVVPCDRLRDALMGQDFVSVHIPLTGDTRGLIGLAELHLMKPTAVLINSSRGGVVDEAALVQALSEGIIAGAAIDVFEQEPPDVTGPLFGLTNVLVTPHMAAMTDGALRRMACDVADGVLSVLAGKRPQNLVNPQVWD